MIHKKNKFSFLGFTLVELIVVITILGILSTIGFVAYSSYLTGVRDANRVSQLKSIADGLELYRTKNSLPAPTDRVEIRLNGATIAWQGYAGKDVLETIEYTNKGVDPSDDTYFTYLMTKDKKNYQLMAYLEEEYSSLVAENILSDTTHAAIDYEIRYPKVIGKQLGILVQNGTNIPLQEVPEINATTGSGYLNIIDGLADVYDAYMEDGHVISGSGTVLKQLAPNASCQKLYTLGAKTDGIYTINPTGGTNTEFDVYCKMTMAGGGWTLIATSADDGQSTWTYTNGVTNNYLTTGAAFGSVSEKEKDFKSQAYLDLQFKDVLFIDKQGIWGAHSDVNPTNDKSMSNWMPMDLKCAFGEGRDFPMESGSISKNKNENGYQQDRMLFFTVYDNDNGCANTTDDHNAYGPTWGYAANSGSGALSPDDPGVMGWGISDNSSYGANEYLTREFGDAKLGYKEARIGGGSLETVETNDGDYIMWFAR